LPDEQEGIATTSLQLGALNRLREKFPVWKDADEFHL
jgi:omega-amidase